MEISKTTCTHLSYQFIILTLLFLGFCYNELLFDLRFLIFLIVLPIFSYQMLILCHYMDLAVPSWISCLQLQNKKCISKGDIIENDLESSASDISSLADIQRFPSFSELREPLPYSRRWEKSVTNLGATPKHFSNEKKSKSWVNLSDSRSTEMLSREGSLDVLTSSSERCSREDKIRKREERATKARSWKPDIIDFDISEENEIASYKDLQKTEDKLIKPLSFARVHEESDLEKSYSFPFRQKRLETWLEMKETKVGQLNQSPGMPYWQTVGYNLAVKYEARRRRRAVSTPTRSDIPNDPAQKSSNTVAEATTPVDKSSTNSKKSTKSASACMNKLKMGISNLISKKKDEVSDSGSASANKAGGKSTSKFKLKNKNISTGQAKLTTMPEFPQFFSNDRPLIFYPKYIPFEKERFEKDVKKKMTELAEEQRDSLQKIK